MSIWDDPELAINNDYITFENKGDTATGTVMRIGVKRWDDGKVCPEILLTDADGNERTLTAGQVKLKALLAEQRPEVGDTITVSLIDIEKRNGGKTLKHFSLDVQRGNGQTSAPTAASASAQDPQAAAVAAALANLTPEQRAAMGLPPAA